MFNAPVRSDRRGPATAARAGTALRGNQISQPVLKKDPSPAVRRISNRLRGVGAAATVLACVVALAPVPAAAGVGNEHADGCFSPIMDQDSRELVRLGVSEVVPGAVLAQSAPGCPPADRSPSIAMNKMGDCIVEFPFPDRPFAPGSPCA